MQQLSTPQLKTREQAEQYLRIEQNTQYLTHLLRYTSNRRRVYYRPQQPCDLRSISYLIVQFSYLLFTCCVKQVNILIGKQFILLNPGRKQLAPEICCEYLLEKDFNELKEEEQKVVSGHFQLHEFANMQAEAYGKYVLHYVDLLLKIACSQKDRFRTAQDKRLWNQYQSLDKIKTFLLSRVQTIEHPRLVILSLEESEIFREYSILVKVMNNSVFSMIKNSKSKGAFGEIVKKEHQLAKAKQSSKGTYQGPVEVQQAIEDFLRFLINIDAIKVEQSISNVEKSEQNKKNEPGSLKDPTTANEAFNKQYNPSSLKQYQLGEVQANLPFDQRSYKCKFHVLEKSMRQFSQKLFNNLKFEATHNYNKSQMEQEPPRPSRTPQPAKNQFIVELLAAKGLLIVKYITPIELNIENTDLVMFQCNNIAYHWSNVNMQLIQKSPNKVNRKKERYLSLKTITHLSVSDRPLFKLLLMIDLVMLCAKIAEPELRRQIIRVQDYHRIEEISAKVNHMINLFVRKIQRYYKIIAEGENGI